MARCKHGFDRPVTKGERGVPCPECDPQRYKFQPGDALEEAGKSGKIFMTFAGATVAGVKIIKELGRTEVLAECGCGRRYRTRRSTITGCKRRGVNAKCAKCTAKSRAAAQNRLAQMGGRARAKQAQEQREREQAEREGRAA